MQTQKETFAVQPITSLYIGFLDLKNIYLDSKVIIRSALARMLWSKTSFLHNGGNVTRLHTSHIQGAQDVF